MAKRFARSGGLTGLFAVRVGAGLAVVAALLVMVGTGRAEAKTYQRHQIKLTHSQTVFVAQNNVGYALSSIPSIPNLVYNPNFGLSIQKMAGRAAARGGCITIGVGTPIDGRGANIDYAESLPAGLCAP